MDVEESHKPGDADRNPSAVTPFIRPNQARHTCGSVTNPCIHQSCCLGGCIVFERKFDGDLPLNPVTLPAVYDLPLTLTYWCHKPLGAILS